MDWKIFIETLQNAELSMLGIMKDLPQFESFLKATNLVVTLENHYFEFKKDLSAFDLAERLPLVAQSDIKDTLSSLLSSYDEAQRILKNTKKEGGLDTTNRNGTYSGVQILREGIIAFPLTDVQIVDTFSIQMIFPHINIEVIQAIKEHPLTNRAKTCSCRACVRCFLF